jgi:hypothetical protein
VEKKRRRSEKPAEDRVASILGAGPLDRAADTDAGASEGLVLPLAPQGHEPGCWVPVAPKPGVGKLGLAPECANLEMEGGKRSLRHQCLSPAEMTSQASLCLSSQLPDVLNFVTVAPCCPGHHLQMTAHHDEPPTTGIAHKVYSTQ